MYTEHLRIPIGAGSLHAERVGRGGHPVVLLHGFGTCTFLWRAVAPRLADAGFTVIAIDLLGHGESDRPLDVAYSLGAQAEYLERALTALRLPAVSVVGQDIGGLVGLLLAAQRTRRVTRAVAINPPDPADLPGPDIRALQRSGARAALSANALFGAMAVLEPLLQGAVADPAHMSDRLMARYLAPWVGRDGAGQLLQQASAVELSDTERPWLSEIRAPVVLMRGERDRWCPPATIDALTRSLSATTVQTIVLPTAGHLVAEDAPDELTAQLRVLCTAERDAVPAGAVEAAPAQRSR